MLESILIGVVIAIATIILLIIVVGGVKAGKKKKKEVEQIAAQQEQLAAQQEQAARIEEEKKAMKVVIAQGESITVGSEGRIPCGEYTMESCDGEEKFNVRVGRYVKEYENGCKIVLTEKQKVTPVSASIILR